MWREAEIPVDNTFGVSVLMCSAASAGEFVAL